MTAGAAVAPSTAGAPTPSLVAQNQLGPNLVFNGSSFESANLLSAKLVSLQPMEYDLTIRPDTLNGRHRVWFYFSVRGARAGQKITMNILGYSKTKSLFREGMAPVVCSSSKPYWERMPTNSIYYYRSPRHDKQYVLSFPFCFERADDTYVRAADADRPGRRRRSSCLFVSCPRRLLPTAHALRAAVFRAAGSARKRR